MNDLTIGDPPTGAQIEAFLAHYGMTQTELARRLHLPNPTGGGTVTINRWKNDKRGKLQPFLGRAFRDLARELDAEAAVRDAAPEPVAEEPKEPKRIGRPPGRKNSPKVVAQAPVAPTEPEPELVIEPEMEQAPEPKAAPRAAAAPRRRRALSRAPAEVVA